MEQSGVEIKNWIEFFRATGFSRRISEAYAKLFKEHELELDMLSDLTHDILLQVGIMLAGHRILILRMKHLIYDPKLQALIHNEFKAVTQHHIGLLPLNQRKGDEAFDLPRSRQCHQQCQNVRIKTEVAKKWERYPHSTHNKMSKSNTRPSHHPSCIHPSLRKAFQMDGNCNKHSSPGDNMRDTKNTTTYSNRHDQNLRIINSSSTRAFHPIFNEGRAVRGDDRDNPDDNQCSNRLGKRQLDVSRLRKEQLSIRLLPGSINNNESSDHKASNSGNNDSPYDISQDIPSNSLTPRSINLSDNSYDSKNDSLRISSRIDSDGIHSSSRILSGDTPPKIPIQYFMNDELVKRKILLPRMEATLKMFQDGVKRQTGIKHEDFGIFTLNTANKLEVVRNLNRGLTSDLILFVIESRRAQSARRHVERQAKKNERLNCMVSTNNRLEYTSENRPIKVDFVPDETLLIPGGGRLGLCMAPGRKKKKTKYTWNRDLKMDLDRIKDFYKTDLIVTLIRRQEMVDLKTPDLIKQIEERQMDVIWFSIKDKWVPRSMERLMEVTSVILQYLKRNKVVVVHCNGGKGRSGTLCVVTLIAMGYPVGKSIDIIRKTRSGTIRNPIQIIYVKRFKKAWRRRTKKTGTFVSKHSTKGKGSIYIVTDDEDVMNEDNKLQEREYFESDSSDEKSREDIQPPMKKKEVRRQVKEIKKAQKRRAVSRSRKEQIMETEMKKSKVLEKSQVSGQNKQSRKHRRDDSTPDSMNKKESIMTSNSMIDRSRQHKSIKRIAFSERRAKHTSTSSSYKNSNSVDVKHSHNNSRRTKNANSRRRITSPPVKIAGKTETSVDHISISKNKMSSSRGRKSTNNNGKPSEITAKSTDAVNDITVIAGNKSVTTRKDLKNK